MCALSHNLFIHPKHVLSDTWNLLPKKESTCTMSTTGIAAVQHLPTARKGAKRAIEVLPRAGSLAPSLRAFLAPIKQVRMVIRVHTSCK